MGFDTHHKWFLGLLHGVIFSRDFEFLRSHVDTVLFRIRYVSASFVEVTHGASSVSLVVATIDLFGGQAQARHHWLCGLEHYDGSSRVLELEQRGIERVECPGGSWETKLSE